ncbi:hypothetical protein FRX31_035479 [Thalictrum thalictroides]|uniref:Uncharacterized protein n=1 Tax=Thalictrum thalictroides TaxID=46969 RepID=A0A7J6UR49_THATH|nr:hypothetical protein FRX31_035479 [Thalictrum thalictroides]
MARSRQGREKDWTIYSAMHKTIRGRLCTKYNNLSEVTWGYSMQMVLCNNNSGRDTMGRAEEV